jgi:hypothetical protein
VNLSVTINFTSTAQMLEFFSRPTGVISPVDRPDAGMTFPPLPQPTPDPAQVFGAPSAAAVVPSSTVPAVPTATSVVATPPVPAPPTVSAAPAPAAPVIPSASAPAVERDAAGLPWDGRIHASTKTKNADHTWRNKRGVDEAELARVTAELRGLPAPAVVAAPPAPAAPPVPPAVISPAAAALPAQALAAAPAAPRIITFGELMVKLQAPMVSGQLPREKLSEVLARLGCPTGIPELVHRPDLVPAADAELCTMLGLPVGAPA